MTLTEARAILHERDTRGWKGSVRQLLKAEAMDMDSKNPQFMNERHDWRRKSRRKHTHGPGATPCPKCGV